MAPFYSSSCGKAVEEALSMAQLPLLLSRGDCVAAKKRRRNAAIQLRDYQSGYYNGTGMMLTPDAHAHARAGYAAPWNAAYLDVRPEPDLDAHPETHLDVHPEPDPDAHPGYDAEPWNAAHRGNADLPLNRRYLLDEPSRNSRPLTKSLKIEQKQRACS
jgi:hypothetical protein